MSRTAIVETRVNGRTRYHAECRSCGFVGFARPARSTAELDRDRHAERRCRKKERRRSGRGGRATALLALALAVSSCETAETVAARPERPATVSATLLADLKPVNVRPSSSPATRPAIRSSRSRPERLKLPTNSSPGRRPGSLIRATYYRGRLGACGPLRGYYAANGPDMAGGGVPCGARFKVRNPATGRTLTVTILDRCACPGHRTAIDLSENAFAALAGPSWRRQGVIRVELERIR